MKPAPWTCEWCDPREIRQPIEAMPTTIRLSWGVIPAWEHKCLGCGAHRLVADDPTGGALEAEGIEDGGAQAVHALGRGAAVLLLFALGGCSCAHTSHEIVDRHEEQTLSRESTHGAHAEERVESGPTVEVEEDFVWPSVFESLPDGGQIFTPPRPQLAHRRTVTHLPVAIGPATVATRTETATQTTHEAAQVVAAEHAETRSETRASPFISILPLAAAAGLLLALLAAWRRWV